MKKTIHQLSFYGKAGSISRIVAELNDEDEVELYYRYEYDVKGLEKQPQIVPKRQIKKLTNNYYQDVKEWLQANYTKYLENKSKNFPKNIDLKNTTVDWGVSTLLSAIGIVLSFVSMSVVGGEWMSAVGVFIFAAPGTYAVFKLKDILDYKSNQKKENFVNEYKMKETELNEYNIVSEKKKKKNPTKYQGLSQEKNLGTTLRRTRVLEK